ncbi:MAG: Unknown protein [uncultured Sulfurovum sp.]|uniref:Uncharacterized protein n=1 Tax=uncultured Sulfurovum sp. TaxID=269237 RepID=A0A6S6TPU4_9BACT|nr:MAG: Unknown protein [uncultured Sulfurovum sp.]
MQEKTIKEQLNEAKEIKAKVRLHPIFQVKSFAWFVLILTVLLMFIENFLKMDELVGGWHIISYILMLIPLAYLAFSNKLENNYVKWFFPLLAIMIIDMFYYSNDMVQYVLPIVFFLLVLVLYFTSMNKVHSLYQTFLPSPFKSGIGVSAIGQFFDNLFVRKEENDIYKRIGLALLITLPFLGVFMALLFSSDESFANFLTGIIDIDFNFDITYIWTVPWYFFFYLFLFVATLSGTKNRTYVGETKFFDMLIVGIFLGMINILFLMFVAMQLAFLFGEPNLPTGTTLATFAREGFFQLMMVMGLVLLIFIFIMRRYKNEKVLMFLLAGLLLQTIMMGLVSLKKMYLYQSIKGATVLRYYVEWFDYFLIVVLLIGLVFLVRKLTFRKLLDVIVILGLVSFTLVVSLNVDGMVASHNIEKFKDSPEKLDKRAISYLSIDALPVVKKYNLELGRTYIRTLTWVESDARKYCNDFSTYHYGYCSKLKKYEE